MSKIRKNGLTLNGFIERLQQKGRYSFTKEEALKELNISENAFRLASLRLARASKIKRVRNSFYVIIRIEYQSSGGPQPLDYIDDLMKYLGQPYYVCLLSAAALFGATHQPVHVLQIATNSPLRPILIGRGKITFITKKNLSETPTVQKNTRTGVITVSSPEATAFDLVKYPRRSGHLSHIATVLVELSEALNSHNLLKLAKAESDIHVVQRLGYLLDRFAKAKVAGPLKDWISRQDIKPTFLRPQSYSTKFPFDKKWQLLVNEKVETDL